jgi:nitroreductase
MRALDNLTTRVSAAGLVEPAPDGAALQQILAAAAAAPDHGRLRPWQFICIRGEARAAFGELLGRTLRARQPDVSEGEIEREKAKAQRAPLIIAVAAALKEHPKIPQVEQLLAAGAAAQNLLLAAHALGFGGVWKTGAPAYDAAVKQALGLAPGDAIVGFLYLGSLPKPLPARPVADASAYTREWTGG